MNVMTQLAIFVITGFLIIKYFQNYYLNKTQFNQGKVQTEGEIQNLTNPSLVRYNTLKGDIVKSRGEQLIADFLYENKIKYVYEWRMHGMTPDFYLIDYDMYIEYWGMSGRNTFDSMKYEENKRLKIRRYEAKGLTLIEIFPEHLNKLEKLILSHLHLSA